MQEYSVHEVLSFFFVILYFQNSMSLVHHKPSWILNYRDFNVFLKFSFFHEVCHLYFVFDIAPVLAHMPSFVRHFFLLVHCSFLYHEYGGRFMWMVLTYSLTCTSHIKMTAHTWLWQYSVLALGFEPMPCCLSLMW